MKSIGMLCSAGAGSFMNTTVIVGSLDESKALAPAPLRLGGCTSLDKSRVSGRTSRACTTAVPKRSATTDSEPTHRHELNPREHRLDRFRDACRIDYVRTFCRRFRAKLLQRLNSVAAMAQSQQCLRQCFCRANPFPRGCGIETATTPLPSSRVDTALSLLRGSGEDPAISTG